MSSLTIYHESATVCGVFPGSQLEVRMRYVIVNDGTQQARAQGPS
jgi:hypothetical protein